MNTIEQPKPDLASGQELHEELNQELSLELPDVELLAEPKINGFDNGTRSIFKEPSLYLSIAIIFIATSVCFSKTPTLFWLSLALMSAVAVAFHFMAERFLFRVNKEHKMFAAPLEGVFVITLGAILPGLSLLAYGVYALSTVQQPNFAEEFAKLALLLVVPFFNFVVWSAVRKRYLVRPRLIGLMNGFAFGLSAAWSAIWASTVLFGMSNLSCKFGWMLLLCTAPFLLFAAFCLGLDLWNKTEANIRRVTATFSVLGVLLSFLFVFTPLARANYVQSLVTNARQASLEEQGKAISALRSVATDEDLRPSKFPLGGFALAELLIPNRGFESGSDVDKELYFKVTGKSYFASVLKGKKSLVAEREIVNPVVGAKIPGLSLAKSQMAGNIDAATLTSSLDWTLTFHNSSPSMQEARCEIAIPKQAVVSRVTLWVDGVPREGAFASSSKGQQSAQSGDGQIIDPLLVTMTAPDRVLLQCYPVPANSGVLKVRLGFKVPVETADGKTCSMKLPQLVATNFIQSRRHRVNFISHDLPQQSLPGLVIKKNADGYSLTGILKATDVSAAAATLVVQRTAPLAEIAALDWYAKKPQYIIQSLKEVARPSVKRLFVVIDSSASLKGDAQQIKQALASIPTCLKPTIVYAGKQAQVLLNADTFEGGQDNWPTLRETIETAAEQASSAVLWIHGPQPIAPKLADSAVLDLVHRVSLFDLQIESGPNSILPALQLEDASGLITYETLGRKDSAGSSEESSAAELKAILPALEGGTTSAGEKRLVVQRSLSMNQPSCPIISDRMVSAQVTCLWAREEVAKLIAGGQHHEASVLGTYYRLVTPVTGAVVLEDPREYKVRGLKPGTYNDSLSRAASMVAGLAGGLVGAPVDPRYGQSNEVGQLADYGYDAARDVSRLLTLVSLLISIVVAIAYLRGRKAKTWAVYAKAMGIVFAAPIVVHLIGTFMINSCGGLGGGL